MPPLEIIRRACIEANPEIMALKFGCEVDSSVLEGKSIFVGRNDYEDENYFVNIDGVGSEDQQYLTEGKVVAIVLGRPIRLADVLLAIDKKYKGHQFATVASNGWFHFNSNRGFWNLRTDSLDQQSPECIEFLANLLNN